MSVVNCCQQPSVRRSLLFCKGYQAVREHSERVAVNNCHHPNTFKSPVMCAVQFFLFKMLHSHTQGVVNCCQLSSFKFPVFATVHILHCFLCLSAKCHEVVHREGVVVQPLVVYNCHHDIFKSPVCHKMCSKYANQYVLVQCTMCTDLQPCC